MTDGADPGEIAGELLEALDRGGTIRTITSRWTTFDQSAAYQVSAELLRRRRARGERPIGHKIGFTNRTMWATYGVDAPVWAPIYDSTVTGVRAGDPEPTLSVAHLTRPRIEPEIVLHFARAPERTDDEAALLSRIDWIAHGYELVQCPFPDWRFQAPDAIAAFGLHGALVVGRQRAVAGVPDLVAHLRAFTVALARDGQVVARGGGQDVLGSPLLAAVHLLRVLHAQPQFDPVRAGEIITTGTLTPPAPVHPGEVWSTELSGLPLDGLRLRLG